MLVSRPISYFLLVRQPRNKLTSAAQDRGCSINEARTTLQRSGTVKKIVCALDAAVLAKLATSPNELVSDAVSTIAPSTTTGCSRANSHYRGQGFEVTLSIGVFERSFQTPTPIPPHPTAKSTEAAINRIDELAFELARRSPNPRAKNRTPAPRSVLAGVGRTKTHLIKERILSLGML